MQLPQQLGSIWQRLTAVQRLSLISLLFFLVVLPVAIWLALSPTSPFSRAGGGPITPPIPVITPPPPPPAPGFPTGTIEGPAFGTAGEKIGSYIANGTGVNLAWVRIYWAPEDSRLGERKSWELAAANDKCNAESSCQVEGYFTPPKAGNYWVTVSVNARENNQDRPCGGNPVVEGVIDPDTSLVPGWVDCGPQSRILVQVSAPKTTDQIFLLQKGYNFVGVTFNKDGYMAEDFLKELNASFREVQAKYIFAYDAVNRSWQTHALGKTNDNNFPIKPWAGYLVYTSQTGQGKVYLKLTKFPMDLTLNSGWSLVSTPIAPPKPYDSAKALLELAQTQGINITSIWRWDPVQKKYEGYRKDTGGTDFPVVTGEAYWIYNNGNTGSLVYPVPIPVSTPTPSPLTTGIPLPPLPQ